MLLFTWNLTFFVHNSRIYQRSIIGLFKARQEKLSKSTMNIQLSVVNWFASFPNVFLSFIGGATVV